MKRLLVALVAWNLGWAFNADAGEVLKITGQGKFRDVKIAHYGEVYYHWVVNDEVCVLREEGRKEKICGKVVRYDQVETVLRMPKDQVVFHQGEKIKIMYSKNVTPRKTASVPEPVTAVKAAAKEGKKPMMNASVGLGTGFSYLFFDAQFKYAISPKVTVGVMPIFINDSGVNTSVKAFGGFLTADYYFHEHFYGFKVESGIGLYSIDAVAGPISESFSPLALDSTVGWRGKISQSGISVGGGAGFQLVANSAKTVIVDFRGILPLLQLDVGYSF